MEDSKKQLKAKLKVYFVLVLLIFLSLVSRLFFLQVVNAEVYQTKSDGNRIRTLTIPARRGDILTRDGKVLATSKPVYTISVSHLNNQELEKQVAQRLESLLPELDISSEAILEKLSQHYRRYEPMEILKLPWGENALEIISRIEERRGELPGVVIQSEPMRYYPEGPLAGHLLGFVGQINEKELETYREYKYDINDKIGKMGLEKAFELWFDEENREAGLRGQKGAQQVEVNAGHRIVRELPVTISAMPGSNLRLTIDYKLQKVMEEKMNEVIENIRQNQNPKARAGAAILLDVRTGAILAMSSKPEMNPNDFVDGSFSQKADYYNDPQLKPTFNRAIQAVYPPGSTFKPITAMAALESGKMKASDPPIYDSGAYWKAPYIKCWQAHGWVNFYQAIARSCNTFFQYAGEKAGIEHISRVAREFGLGETTGLKDLGGEAKGVLPTPEWKKELNSILVEAKYAKEREKMEEKYEEMFKSAESSEEKERLMKSRQQEERVLEARYKIDLKFETTWHPFDTYNTSIGQGSNSYSVLQLANYTATLANGGRRYRPYLVDQIIAGDGRILYQSKPEIIKEVDVSLQSIEETRLGMLQVTQPGGTAWSLFRHFPDHIKVAAKTGTAQTGLRGDDRKKDFHGVFIAFAPYDNPEIAFAGVIEYGQSGSGSAGLVAKALFEEYFGIYRDQEEELLPEEFFIEFPID